ncbi:Fe-S cluster assembly protein SufD [Sneathiella marina]|uniref:Fe-S cluster assembly protein SufD n=1 Tax=Sneathiella marina TaxID=2950108 RepID=A0ABY4W870_9PROT|nr:Fe-S cluster assembly protein SufD [Sneathiella marina]USG63258.1 Fe-S cluster assembly protein SufD [Sneathiella marina]
MKNLTPLAQNYVDRFAAELPQLPGHQDPATAQLRTNGLNAFADLDFPNHRIEEWRFTNLNGLTKGVANDAAEPGETSLPNPEFDAGHTMVFKDGRFDAAASQLGSLPTGVELTSLAAELDVGNADLIPMAAPQQALVALNTAFMEDGFVLKVAAGVTLDQPLRIRFLSTNATDRPARHMRNIIRMGDGAQVTLLEEHVSEATTSYFTNPQTSISLQAGAVLRHFKYQNESIAAFHLALTECDVADDAIYENFSLSTGGKLSRNELTTKITGSGAKSILNGAYLMRGKQHCDTTTLTLHTVPQNESAQIYKGVLDGEARGIFQGKIHIAEDAQQVAGDQLSKALLLSDRATVACKPELEIYADDVKCSHGATSGELDEDALFYLQSRGIDEKSARKMLIDAFLADVIEEISDDRIKAYFSDIATEWLDQV